MNAPKSNSLVADVRAVLKQCREEAIRGDVEAPDTIRAAVLLSFTIETCSAALIKALAKE